MSPPIRRVALRLQGWTAWHLSLIRGVQAYAHAMPQWRLHIDAGPREASRVETGHLKWDGIITSVLRSDGAWRKLIRDPAVQIVGISSAAQHAVNVPVVRVDEAIVADTVGNHLLAGGFRRIAYFGPVAWGRHDVRAEAVRAFAAAHQLPCDLFGPPPANSGWDFSFPMRHATRWVARLPKPVGIVVWNMGTARYVVEACLRAGVAVPMEVAVVAADDDPNMSETFEPSISGVVLPSERVAYRAAELLDHLMGGGAPPKEAVLVPPSKVIRIRQSSDAMSLPDREVHLAVQYIREHAGESLKVQQVARAVGISRSRLDEEFVRVIGHTPHEELVQAHMARAAQLLVETPWTLDRVAAAAGFGTARSFHRVFLERHGKTPTAYRTQFRMQSGGGGGGRRSG